MNDLSSDFQELKQFVADLKADRAATKAKEAREAWTKHVSISLVLIAVLAAAATQKSGGFSTGSMKHLSEASYRQGQASDQWAFYQAKSIKRHLTESEIGRAKASGVPDLKLEERLARYDKEAEKISATAKDLEEQRDAERKLAEQAGGVARDLGMVVTMYQVGVACGSICLVTKRKGLWYLALGVAAYATLRMALILSAA
jgi:transposase